MSFDQLWAECERLQARVDSLREENARLTRERDEAWAEAARQALLVQRYEPAYLGLPHVVRERDEAVIHLGQYGRDVVKENAALRAEGVSTRTELIRLRDKVEMLLNQNREIAASNADHVRWHREKEAEIDRLREALTFYSDTRRYQGANQPYRDGDDPFTPTGSPFLIDVMRDAGTIARAALRGGGK